MLARLVPQSWPGELATHFRLQYAWALGVSGSLLFAAHWWPAAAIAMSLAAMNLPGLWRYRASRRAMASTSDHRPLRILCANLLWTNRSYDRFHRCVTLVQPDVLVLEEVSLAWAASLARLAAQYPFTATVRQDERYGIYLFSRMPLARASLVPRRPLGPPSLVADLDWHGRRLTLIGAHPFSPKTPRRLRQRNRQLRQLAAFAQRRRGPLMILGDLNTTSWSPTFQAFLRTTRLRDSRLGFGLQPTWPVRLPWLRITLDHCLVSEEIVITHRAVGPSIGSDHYPIIVECVLQPGLAPRPDQVMASPASV